MPFYCYNKNDYCDHSENCDNCNVWVLGKGCKEVPSNADRIRAMTDEELAKIILCPKQVCDKLHILVGRTDCEACSLEWLQQPAEGA